MKRRTLKFMACAAVMALTLSVTACGGSNDRSNANSATETESTADAAEPETEPEDEIETEVEAEAEEVEAEAEEAAASGEYETLEDFYNDPTVKSLLDSQYSALAEEGMSASIEAKGNEFIVIVKFEDSSVIVDGIGEALEQAMDIYADTFTAAAAEFDSAIGEEGACTVTMRYTDPDDNVLAEKSYKAK